MKIFHVMDENSSIVSQEDKEKIAILKLTETGKFVENIGVRDGQFFIIPENAVDGVYLDYKAAMLRIDTAFRKQIDQRLLDQKSMEFHNKKAEVVRRIMEMPK
jgi:hypothetical protein|tara:strand:- start:58 stop:366 length:309 start_codon:yes stop_codon:yes gene_type:complete